MSVFSRILTAALALSVTQAFANDLDNAIAQRAQAYNSQFRSRSTSTYLDDVLTPGVPGLRKLMTVLPGAVYRSGGPSGQRPLPPQVLKSLCEAGFSLAVYGYTVGFTQAPPTTCVTNQGKQNSLEYIAGSILDNAFKARVMEKINHVIHNPSTGPVLVHCWNGDHASGELAAITLRQFCGWDAKPANAYWLRHASGAALISRIGKYAPQGALSLPQSEREILCTQRP